MMRMRSVKVAEERRNEILDAASKLFARKGFEGTSTNDILEEVGIARGTLYYHYKSKEDIMDALVERYNARLLGAAHKIAADKNIPVLERIALVIMALKLDGEGSVEIMKHVHGPKNALMHQKIQKIIIKGVTPILTGIIREGNEQGLFNTPYPYECMEMMVAYTSIVLDDNSTEMSCEEEASRLQAAIFNMERMLGVKEGCFGGILKVLGSQNGGGG